MKSKLYYDYPDDHNRWLVSYSDFITMLLALFIVLYALSQMDIANMRTFTKSLKNSFTNIELDLNEKRKILEGIFSKTQAKIFAQPVAITPKKQVEELKQKLEELEKKLSSDIVKIDNTKKALEDSLKDTKNIKMTSNERGLIISMSDTVLFDPGADVIKSDAMPALDKIVQILIKLPNSIRIEGHTDNQPIATSKYPSNWELSTSRATSIVKLLVNKYKFNPAKLSAAGYGEFKPISTNTTPEGRQDNRRVDIVILNSGSELFEPQQNNIP